MQAERLFDWEGAMEAVRVWCTPGVLEHQVATEHADPQHRER
jgi:hypothetical protein